MAMGMYKCIEKSWMVSNYTGGRKLSHCSDGIYFSWNLGVGIRKSIKYKIIRDIKQK